MLCRRLVVTGRVHDVFYRDWLVEQAEGFGITGWVRNRVDGSVEAMVAGSSEMIDAIVASARKGSPASRVADVAIEDAPEQAFERFEKRATA